MRNAAFFTPMKSKDAPAIQDLATKLLALLASGSDLQMVSWGPFAVELQLPNAPSPHAVNREASCVNGLLRLTFNMTEDEIERRFRWLEERARALGVSFALDEATAPDA